MQLRDLEEEFSKMKARINVLEQFCFKNVSWKVLMEHSTDLVLARADASLFKANLNRYDYEMDFHRDDDGNMSFRIRPYYSKPKASEPPFVAEMRADGVLVLWEPEPGVW